jgi:phage-related protein
LSDVSLQVGKALDHDNDAVSSLVEQNATMRRMWQEDRGNLFKMREQQVDLQKAVDVMLTRLAVVEAAEERQSSLEERKAMSVAEQSIAADSQVLELGGKVQLLQNQLADVSARAVSSAHALVDSKFSDVTAEVSSLKSQLKSFMHTSKNELDQQAEGLRSDMGHVVSGVKTAVAGVDQKFAYLVDVQQLQAQVAAHAHTLSRVESSVRLEIETVVSAMSEGLQQQADLRSRAAEDTLADIQTVWDRCRDALSKTEAEVAHNSDYLQSVLRSQIQERIEGHESVVRDVNAALAEMANQLLKLREDVSSQLRLSAAKTKTLAKGVKTAWSDVEAVRSDCSTQLASAAMSISEMKSKISIFENKDIAEVRQGQQHADLLLKDIERRVSETEEAIKRMHAQIAAENSMLHSIVSDASARQGQRLEDVRGAIAEQLNMTLQNTMDGVWGRIASVEGLQQLNASNNTALGSEMQV